MSDAIFLLAKSGDKDAIANVIQTVEPFIIKQCRKMNLRNYDFEDLKQISYVAVLHGIKKSMKTKFPQPLPT
ncbi:MAG: helix-turn-helix domain-containing protein [Clostridiaceae bacterium]